MRVPVFFFSSRRRHTRSLCDWSSDVCSSDLRGRPNAGPGVKRSMLGTIKVKGKSQVTYGGHPLYEYSGDTSPGSTSYVGVSQFGAKWRAVKIGRASCRERGEVMGGGG